MEATAKNLETAKPAPDASAEKKKRSPFLILGIVIGAFLLAVGVYLLLTAGEENTDDAQVESDVVPIGARVFGQVKTVMVHENDVVKVGQPLLQLDDADYIARLAQAEAELLTAQAQADAADAQATVTDANAVGGKFSAEAALVGSSVGVGNAEAQVAGAQAGLLRAQTEVSRTKLDLDRNKELRAANAVTQERLDNAQIAYDSAQAQLQQAQAQLDATREGKRLAESRVNEAKGRLNQSTPVQAQIAAARAQAALAHARVKSAEAQRDLAKLQLSYTKVVAPVDGVVSKLTAHEGQLLGVGQMMAELVPTKVYIVANFKETQVGKMKAPQKVKISIDAFPHHSFEGVVESLSGGTGARFSLLPPDNASGNFVKVVQRLPVRISLVNPPSDVVLRAGMSADVTVITH